MTAITDYTKVDEILAKYEKKDSFLIAIIQDIQTLYRYLPKDILEYISDELDISIAKVYSVATFYENFSLEPKGKYVIRICDGTACHVRKSIPILQEFKKALKLTGKKITTDDMLFTVETVSCLGACGLAPVITINDKVYPAMTPKKANELLDMIRQEEATNNETN